MSLRDGRFRLGNEKAAKLTDADVLYIRAAWANREKTQGQLSRMFSVTVGQIGRICRGESWQHVAMPVKAHEFAPRTYRMGTDEVVELSAETIEKLQKAAKNEATREDPYEEFMRRAREKSNDPS